MNSIKRYRIARACDFVMFNDDGVNVFGDIITDYKSHSWCKYSDVEQLQARVEELVKLVKVLLENADEQVIDECVSVHIDDISALNSFLNEFRDDNEMN